MVGSLIYLTHIRPNIVNAVRKLSKFMSELSKDHITVAKRILKYIKRTKSYGIMYETEKNFKFTGYIDSNWAKSMGD